MLGDGELLVELLPLHWDEIISLADFLELCSFTGHFPLLKCHVKVVDMANA